VISGEEGLKKPDERFYRVLLNRHGLNAGECLFIDDRPDNVLAAKRVGFQAVHLPEKGNLQEVLGPLGIHVEQKGRTLPPASRR
jgi:2-haloacid dehalogenase